MFWGLWVSCGGMMGIMGERVDGSFASIRRSRLPVSILGGFEDWRKVFSGVTTWLS